jgi:hypothetical protein
VPTILVLQGFCDATLKVTISSKSSGAFLVFKIVKKPFCFSEFIFVLGTFLPVKKCFYFKLIFRSPDIPLVILTKFSPHKFNTISILGVNGYFAFGVMRPFIKNGGGNVPAAFG